MILQYHREITRWGTVVPQSHLAKQGRTSGAVVPGRADCRL